LTLPQGSGCKKHRKKDERQVMLPHGLIDVENGYTSQDNQHYEAKLLAETQQRREICSRCQNHKYDKGIYWAADRGMHLWEGSKPHRSG